MDVLGAAPFAIITAGIGWLGGLWVYRDKQRKEKLDQSDRLEIHRDDLTFQLLQAARADVTVASTEMKSLREELKNLRSLEQHFFHFLQALDHLEAILYAETRDMQDKAERAAKAFLKRMRRLNEAKGTLANEAQIADSIMHVAEGKISSVEDGILPQKPGDIQ